MTPSFDTLQDIRDKIETLYRLFGLDPLNVTADEVPSVVVILGSSRSGSSLLFHLLSESGGFWAPQGEETPFFRAEGLGYVSTPAESDEIFPPISEFIQAGVFSRIINDLGRRVPGGGLKDSRFQLQTAVRLLLQWPDLRPERLHECLLELGAKTPDVTVFWLQLFERLDVDSHFYDLEGFHASRFRALEVPEFLLEEPPFVLNSPRVVPSGASDLAAFPILLKSSTHAYRMSLLKTVFPHTRFQWVVLTRNPAGTVNGLMDGWRSNAFHSHNMEQVARLNIQGYTDISVQGDRWWKFDLPPGWSHYCSQTLTEVCAFQWHSAYTSILSSTRSAGDPVLKIRYEDLVNPVRCSGVLRSVFEFAGVKPKKVAGLEQTRAVMASANPVPVRWRQREDLLRPLVHREDISALARELGYDVSQDNEWT